MSTHIPIISLFIVAFLVGLLNVAITGNLKVEPEWRLLERFIIAGNIYWWYYTDKTQRHYRASIWLNIGVIVISIVVIPVYLFRSRGRMQGAKAFGLFLLILVLLIVTLYLGGSLGELFAPDNWNEDLMSI